MERTIVMEAEAWVKEIFAEDSTGHDWHHTNRVRNNAIHIAKEEKADIFICEMAALLHDVADEKFNESERSGLQKVEEWLQKQKLSQQVRNEIISSIITVSYKGGNNTIPTSMEGKIVQDADRLDAIGAIGIARCFMYAGATGGAMHTPGQPPRDKMTQKEYREKNSSAINHFYEKLLKLKELMMTKTGAKLAEERHQFMKLYLDQFLQEWSGEK